MKHFSIALTNLRRSPYQSLAAILLVSITFFVGYVFSLFVLGTNEIMNYFETRPQIIGFFELDASATQIEQAKKAMEVKPYVTKVSLVSKNDALKIYQETNKEDPLLLELVTADILPASIEVSGADVDSLNTIKEDLGKISGIEEVVFQQNIIDSLRSWTLSARYVGLASVAILSFTSFLTIVVLIGMKISNKRSGINIMHLIGASQWYIKGPYVCEGLIYGFVGSILGWVSMYVGLLYITPWLKAFLGPIPLLPVAPSFLLIQLGIGTLAGMLLAGSASASAVQRVLRK